MDRLTINQEQNILETTLSNKKTETVYRLAIIQGQKISKNRLNSKVKKTIESMDRFALTKG